MNDAIVIGGGLYGAVIATYLAKKHGLKRVILIEREKALLTRASYHNQARIHNGYHYPRSLITAYRSRKNFFRFVKAYPEAIKKDFTSVYAIARGNSKVTAKQFEHFCHQIGASLIPAPLPISRLFEKRLIEKVFIAEEWVFDIERLAERARHDLEEAQVKIELNLEAKAIKKDGEILVHCQTHAGNFRNLSARFVFNCTYASLNQLAGDFSPLHVKLKHEIAEMALIQIPPALYGLGITVMDGAFFSLMPFPSRNLHSLSHVRYTPHSQWLGIAGRDPYLELKKYEKISRADRMIRDAARYLPAMLDTEYKDSLFEVKTVLRGNENDDGRPILFERHNEIPGFFSILGGKIDNIFDVLEFLDRVIVVSEDA